MDELEKLGYEKVDLECGIIEYKKDIKDIFVFTDGKVSFECEIIAGTYEDETLFNIDELQAIIEVAKKYNKG